jgi:hypothetical protein
MRIEASTNKPKKKRKKEEKKHSPCNKQKAKPKLPHGHPKRLLKTLFFWSVWMDNI